MEDNAGQGDNASRFYGLGRRTGALGRKEVNNRSKTCWPFVAEPWHRRTRRRIFNLNSQFEFYFVFSKNWKEKTRSCWRWCKHPEQVVYACTRAAARNEALKKTTTSHESFAKHAESYWITYKCHRSWILECLSLPLARCTSLGGEKKSTSNMIENAESLLSEIAENSKTSNQTEAVYYGFQKLSSRLST